MNNFLKILDSQYSPKPGGDKLGGVDFNAKKILDIMQKSGFTKIAKADLTKRVNGVYFNTDENLCSFILSNTSKVAVAGGTTGIDLSDLAVALFVYCNDAVKCKNISFSLDPLDEKFPEGDF